MLNLKCCLLIIEMQSSAIIEAALSAIDAGINAKADIIVPLIAQVEEIHNQAALILLKIVDDASEVY